MHVYLLVCDILDPIHRIFVIGFAISISALIFPPRSQIDPLDAPSNIIQHHPSTREHNTHSALHNPLNAIIPSRHPINAILHKQAIPANHDTTSQDNAVGGEITAIFQTSHTSPRFHHHHHHHHRHKRNRHRAVVTPVTFSGGRLFAPFRTTTRIEWCKHGWRLMSP
jgi:hypothetical protein